MFKHVPDGIYDSLYYLTRYQIIDGTPRTVISKMWVDTGGPADVSENFKLPWGSYPDLPAKPSK